MENLKPAQLKGLSEFLNTIAATWFSAGVISPLFIKPENLFKTVLLAGIAIIMSLFFLIWSLALLKKVKL
jgi:hypothetical protein